MAVSDRDDVRRTVRREAAELLQRLSSPEREAFLVRCWMSHDARWFMTVARELGIGVANRINQAAAREAGRVEARRIVDALELPAVRGVDDYLLVQEVLIGLLGPDLLDYRVAKLDERAVEIRVERCFAHENTRRAGLGDRYECGIFARIAGWLDALGLAWELRPPLGPCLKAQGRECVHAIVCSPRRPLI